MATRHDYLDAPQDKFGKAQIIYPTPNIEDVVIIEKVPVRTSVYKKAAFNTPHPDVAAAKLVSQKVSVGDDDKRVAVRVYATLRADQDLYNYAIKFSADSRAHHIIARSYILPRAGYAPVDVYTADPMISSALLTTEETSSLDSSDPDLHSLFIRVNRLYETLPGPILSIRSLGSINLTPEKYRRQVRTVETNQPVPGNYTFPEGLTGDQTQITLQQETIAKARLKIVEEVIGFDESPLIGGKTGEFGNLIINEEVVDEGTPPLSGELIQDSQVTPFGNGKAVRITVKYPDNLFDLQKVKRSLGQQNQTPEKYRRLVRTLETEKPVPVNYTFPTGLTGDQTFIEFAQKTITEARLRIIEEVINTDEAPLVGSENGEWGQYIITEEVVDEGTSGNEGFGVRESRVTALGNGKAIRITIRYQTSDFVTALKLTAQGVGYTSAPTVVFTGGGGSGAAATAYITDGKVTRLQMTALGSGYRSAPVISFTGGSSSTDATATAYLGVGNIIYSQRYEERQDVVVPTQKRLIPAGTERGNLGKDIKSLDYSHSVLTEVDITAIREALRAIFIVTPSVISYVPLPSELVSIKAIAESMKVDGMGDDYDASVTFNGQGQPTISARSSASGVGEALLVPELLPQVQSRAAHIVPGVRCQFYMEMPFSISDVFDRVLEGLIDKGVLEDGDEILPWPKFSPVEHVIASIGEKLALRAGARAALTEGGSGGIGFGLEKSQAISTSIKSTHINDVIHGEITVGWLGTPPDPFTLVTAEAHANAFNAVLRDQVLSGRVGFKISPSLLPATPNATSVPTTGIRLFDLHRDLFGYNQVMLDLELLDFADLPGGTGGIGSGDLGGGSGGDGDPGSGGGGPGGGTDLGLPTIEYESFTSDVTALTLRAIINRTGA